MKYLIFFTLFKKRILNLIEYIKVNKAPILI